MRGKKTGSQSKQWRDDISSHWVRGKRTCEAPSSDKAYAIFQPDILVPEQYRATFERTFHLESEKILMLAVLRDAVACFQDNLWGTEGRKRQLFLDASQWIMDENAGYFFSFENICDSLGLDAGYMRQGLMHWQATAMVTRAAQIAAHQPAIVTDIKNGRRRAAVSMRHRRAHGVNNV